MSDSRAVCLPRLGAVSLLVLRAHHGRPRQVLFDIAPKYMKALVRWFRVPERMLLSLFSVLAGAPVVRAAPEAERRGSAALNLEGMKTVSRILLRLSPEIEAAGWTRVLASAVGEHEATAYFHRRFPWHSVWPDILAVTLALNALDGERHDVLWSASWPEPWERVVAEEIDRSFGVESVPWPGWYRRVSSARANAWATVRALVLIAGRLARHRLGRARPRAAVVAIEYIEPGRFNGGPSATNFMEDAKRLKRSEIAYFLTAAQARYLHRHGVDVRAGLRAATNDGLRVLDLRAQRFSRESVTGLARLAAEVLRRQGRLGAACLGHAFVRGCDDVATYSLLFDAVAPKNVLHTQNPNGDTGGRFESAVLTGLARRRGSRSVGYQNRCTYDSVYEDSFDCYDVYLAWGDRWRSVLADDNRFISRVALVGCVDNAGRVARLPKGRERVRVSVFPSELEGTLLSRKSVLTLLMTCADLAERFRQCAFKVKMKDPHHVDELLRDDAFRNRCQEVRANFEFVRLPRHETGGLIDSSEIVLATAWTTPGATALLLNRRVVYYNELRSGGRAFDDLPNMVAGTPDELVRLVTLALDDYHRYAADNHAQLDALDPFRDGQAQARVIDELLQ